MTQTTSGSTHPSFSAKQISAVLGISRQAVLRRLASVPEHSKELVRGNEASVWRLESLPESFRAKLEDKARARGYESVESLLHEPCNRFESVVPVNQLAPAVVERARKLRNALARPLEERNKGLRGVALEEIGLQEYQRTFGFRIAQRHFRRLLKRVIARDAGEGNWNRLDLYLEDRSFVSHSSKGIRTSPTFRNAERILGGYASQVRNPNHPTHEETAILWNAAFEQSSSLVQSVVKLRQARKVIRRTLWKCGVTLAKNEVSLGQLWRIKEARWRKADGHIAVLKDRRGISSGNHRAPTIPQRDLDLVIGHAFKFNGRVSQAWRHVIENRLLSPEVQSYYEGVWRTSKSYVPGRIRDLITTEVRLLRDIHHGPRTAELRGAYIDRNWNTVAAGDWYQADDVTLNNYYYAPDEQGNLALMRGQVLLMIDLRSCCILSFAILDQRNYTAHAIRSLITRTCDAHGLPREGFYFERGIWESSKLLKGDARISSNDLTWMESEGGLRELGLRFVHSSKPRSKPIEQVIGQLQNLLDGQPGDAGRNEMKDKFERLQTNKRLVELGRAPATQYFYNHDQWTRRIAEFCEEYNQSRNDGKMTGGLTPFQAWKQYQSEPLVKLPNEARYLLAHHKRPVLVGRNGITLRFGKQNFTYRNAETGKLRGQRVLAWFNPDLPELLPVTDMHRERCFTVERAEDVPAMDAPQETLEREQGRVEAHNAYARHRYRVLAEVAGLNARPTIMDKSTADLGRTIQTQKEITQLKRTQRVRRISEGKRAFANLGFTRRPGEEISEDEVIAAQKLSKLLNRRNSA